VKKTRSPIYSVVSSISLVAAYQHVSCCGCSLPHGGETENIISEKIIIVTFTRIFTIGSLTLSKPFGCFSLASSAHFRSDTKATTAKTVSSACVRKNITIVEAKNSALSQGNTTLLSTA